MEDAAIKYYVDNNVLLSDSNDFNFGGKKLTKVKQLGCN